MNERIREFAIQADEYCRDYVPNWNMNDYNKKFAELIVKDCIKELLDWKKEPFPFDEHTAVWILKEHFGVEE